MSLLRNFAQFNRVNLTLSLVTLDDDRQVQVSMRLVDNEVSGGQKINLLDAEKSGTSAGHGDYRAVRGMVVKRTTVLAQNDAGEGERKVVIFAGILAIHERVVGEIDEQDEMMVPTSHGPSPVGFRSVGESLLVIGAGDEPTRLCDGGS